VTLRELELRLKIAVAPEDVFGSIKGPSVISCWRHLVKLCHPDVTKDPRAAEIFAELTRWKAIADAKMLAGTYGNGKPHVMPAPKPPPASPIRVTIGKHTYVLREALFEGDIATLYASDEPFIFKIARSGADNDLMEAEQKALRTIFPDPHKLPQGDTRLLPRLIDSFSLSSKPGSNRRVNMLTRHDDHFSLVEVESAHPRGIDFRDFAWMFKRALAGMAVAHRAGVIHGAILPPHVLIQPIDHGAKIVDWCYAVPVGSPMRAIVNKYRDFYPPEVFKKGPATPGLDIYMLAMCGQWLLDANAPRAIRSFLRGCLLAMPSRRPQDAIRLHREFDELLEQLVGPKKYRPFDMPSRP
jgi:hypothetical protein